ncbi:MAG: indole-3-glycerol phosphate synthase TrpC [Chitinispirillia bacterium]|nr:indole-3-glycerol phosphate synthase TrpC [Chitinispirillia bacterium]MCL2267822.1 indole-3-glycerol phosphate synthase TrpC [Chitinispirillia bacterium]
MNKILQTIIDRKHDEVRILKDMKSELASAKRTDVRRPFVSALDKRPELAVIAEVKKASPSKGIIKADFDPIKISTAYEESGASAISVLTDENFFQGHTDYLKSVRANVSIPVLRKDFIIDTLQVQHTAMINADAMLLIAAALDDSRMKDLYQAAGELDIDVLIEIHNTRELDRAMKIEPAVIGINNRNLDTFVTDVAVTIELIRHIPQNIIVVSESGIEGGDQAAKLSAAGVRALLVGESLMRADDIGSLVRELRLAV